MVKLNKNQFWNNQSVQHEHSQRITSLSYSYDGGFLVSVSADMCKVWRIYNTLVSSYVVIPGNVDSEYTENGVNALACCDIKAETVAIYRGKLHFSLYTVTGEGEYNNKSTINLKRELVAAGVNDFNFAAQRDQVLRIRLICDD